MPPPDLPVSCMPVTCMPELTCTSGAVRSNMDSDQRPVALASLPWQVVSVTFQVFLSLAGLLLARAVGS